MPTAHRTLDGWRQVGGSINGTASGDKFGSSIALSKDASCVAIGSPRSSVYSNNAGEVRVFQRQAQDIWEQVGNTIYGENKDTRLGSSLDLSDSCEALVAGGVLNANDNGIRTGHVRVYRLIDNEWQQQGIDIEGVDLFDNMGRSVSISGDGNIVAVGASRYGDDFGLVRVFRYSNITCSYSKQGEDIVGTQKDAFMGHVVSISSLGDTMAVGSFGVSSSGLTRNGQVRIFNFVENVWKQKGQAINGTSNNDQFGLSVALSASGDTFAASTPYYNQSSGLLQVYRFIGDSWQQLGSDIDGPNTNALLGWSSSISADGDVVAVGSLAKQEDPGRPDTSRVFVYKLEEDGEWVMAGDIYTGEDFSTALIGRIVSLSGDGDVLATSVPIISGDNVVKVFERFDMEYPSSPPTFLPSGSPVISLSPSESFTDYPSSSLTPTKVASNEPSQAPSVGPSTTPSAVPSGSVSPTSSTAPTFVSVPTAEPSTSTSPSSVRSASPSAAPSALPSVTASSAPSISPSASFSSSPSAFSEPTVKPSLRPSFSQHPSFAPDPSSIFGEKWEEVDSISIEFDDLRGLTLAISGDGQTIAVGNSLHNNENGNKAGCVNIFRLTNDFYQQLGGTIILANGGAGDNFGQSVALSVNGDTCVVGASNFDGAAGANSGIAAVYNLSPEGEWILKGNTVEGLARGDKAGASVDISDDGNIMILGAYLNDNENGDSAGHVRAYTYNALSERWDLFGDIINGESDSDGFGASVSTSSEGTTIAVGKSKLETNL